MMPDGWSAPMVLTVLMLIILTINTTAGKKKLSKTALIDDRFEGCKYYKKGRVGVCNLATDTQIKTLALKKGGSHCPRSKNITQPCNTLKCKYRFAGWGSCNTADNTRVKLFKLRDGQPETCPSEKRKFRQCKSGKRKKVDCRYRKGPWSECDPLTHVKSKSLILKKGEESDCQQVKTVIKKCKPLFKKAALKSIGLPISAESSPNESVQSVFSLKLPLPPGQLHIQDSDITDTSVRMSWHPGPHATEAKLLGYIIEYFSISGKKHVWVTASNDIEDNTYTVKKLQPGTSYMFQVRAKNAIGAGPASPPSQTIRTHNTVYSEPSRPKDLRLRPSSKSVIVDWAPPPAADLVLGYILSYGRGLPDTYSTVVDKHQLYYTIHDLDPNSEYVVKLKAFNKVGEGQPIYDAVKTLKEWSRNSVLMPPVGLQSNAQSASSIVVAWSDENQKEGVAPPENYLYMVRYRLQMEDYRYLNTTHTGIQIHNLLPFREYEVSVRVVQGKDLSSWSMSTVSRTHEAAPTTCPSDVTVLNDKLGSIVVTWQPPVKANGVITGYTILYTIDHKQTDRDWTTIQVDGEQLSTRVNRVTSKQTYYFKVQARNRKGYGPFSSIVAFTTSAAAPATAPTDVTVSHTGDESNTVTISWQPPLSPNGVITGYLIYYTTDGTQPDRDWVLEGVTGDTLSTTISYLTPCTLYFFKIQARNREGFGPMSLTSKIKTLGKGPVKCSAGTKSAERLLPPVGLKARKVTSKSAVLLWKDITMKGSKELRDDVVYVVRYKRVKPSLGATYENHTVHDQSLTITGLVANTEYEMAVKTVWNSVQSPWSLTLTIRTKETAPGGPPEDVTITIVSDDSPGTVTVAWQPPVKPNGLITGYLLYYTAKPDAGDGDWVIVEVGGDHLSLVLKGLTLDTKYFIKVQAGNGEGFGPMSHVVIYTVMESGCTEPGCSRPTNPCNNSPCPRGTTCVTMTTENAKYICMCSDGKLRKDCTLNNN